MPSEDRRRAEKAARMYLELRGYKILEQNWGLGRNKIDIIAKKGDLINLVEVQYRNASQSGGLEILTASKMLKMRAAGEAWVAENKFSGNYIFSTLELASPGYAVIGFSEDVL